jgi:hypothetical protein
MASNMDDKYVYVILSKTGTLLSKAIGALTEGKYTHASISFDESFNKLYSFGRTNPNNPFFAGFVEENLYDGVYKKFKSSICIIYKVKVTERQYEKLQNEIESFIYSKIHYRYNFIGLFGVLLNKPLKRENHYFCSQFVSEVLINSGIYSPNKIPELIKPIDLTSIENKELIYEGLITACCLEPFHYISLVNN